MRAKTTCQRKRYGQCTCNDYRCPERKAFYRLISTVDPRLMEDAPIAALSSKRIWFELNLHRWDIRDTTRKITMRERLLRINRFARGRYAVVWDMVDAPVQAVNTRPEVKWLELVNFTVRGSVTERQLARINKVIARGTKHDRVGSITELFVPFTLPGLDATMRKAMVTTKF